jgi:RNA polymerase sigma-70 factor (ECF subfamily)
MYTTALTADTAAELAIANAAVNAAVPARAAAPQLDLDALFREHRRALTAFVKRYVRNEDDAEDVVQATFLEAFRCADRFEGGSKASTWLFGIALNLARNHVRSRIARPDTQDSADIDDLADTLAAPDSDPAELVERRDMARKALAILSKLSPELQDTFNAVLDTGDTYELAAQHLGVPVGTVRSRLNRIRQQVRTLRVAD